MTQKRNREDGSQRQSEIPPTEMAMQGDSILNVGADFSYQTLQGLNLYPPAIETIQYEVVAQIPRKQGFDLRVFAMFGGKDSISSSIGSLNQTITVTLLGAWSTMIQTSKANVTPTVAVDQCGLVFNTAVTIAADNISGGNQQIVMGAMRSGVVQDFTGDVYNKIESTTVLTKNKLQENCLSRALLKKRVATSSSVCRTFLLSDIVAQQILWVAGNNVAIVAKWAAGFCQISTGAAFGSTTLINMKQEVPYGVLPYFYFGDTTLQIIHIIVKWGGATGLIFAFVLQPFESMGFMPPRGTDGTWVASIVIGCTNASLVTLQGLTNASGMMRMYCPTSIPSIAFTGLSNNVIYMNGSAFATAPPANPISESYGGHPPEMQNMNDFLKEVQETISIPTTSKESNTISFY